MSEGSDHEVEPTEEGQVATELTADVNVEAKGVTDPDTIPIPPPVPHSGMSILTHKLWIGNLDKRLTEQNILQFVTKYGEVVSFRYLFKAGTERAEPRGYCFVEYSTREEAERAKVALDRKRALGKKIAVDWARVDQGAKKMSQMVSETWDASTVSETLDSGASTAAKIAALEAKLKQMDEESLTPSVTKKPRLMTREHRHKNKTVSDVKIIHRPSKKHSNRTTQKYRSNF